MADDRLTGLELQIRRLVDTWEPKFIMEELAREFERTHDTTNHEDNSVQMRLAAAHLREDADLFS